MKRFFIAGLVLTSSLLASATPVPVMSTARTQEVIAQIRQMNFFDEDFVAKSASSETFLDSLGGILSPKEVVAYREYCESVKNRFEAREPELKMRLTGIVFVAALELMQERDSQLQLSEEDQAEMRKVLIASIRNSDYTALASFPEQEKKSLHKILTIALRCWHALGIGAIATEDYLSLSIADQVKYRPFYQINRSVLDVITHKFTDLINALK